MLLGQDLSVEMGDLGAGTEGGEATELREVVRVVGEKLALQREEGALRCCCVGAGAVRVRLPFLAQSRQWKTLGCPFPSSGP